jgi:hypothetical protein
MLLIKQSAFVGNLLEAAFGYNGPTTEFIIFDRFRPVDEKPSIKNRCLRRRHLCNSRSFQDFRPSTRRTRNDFPV